jgi:chloramphenicol 3-O-phosphotransferase
MPPAQECASRAPKAYGARSSAAIETPAETAAERPRDAIYDLEVDTTSTPPSILARQLIDRMQSLPRPMVVDRLRARYA